VLLIGLHLLLLFRIWLLLAVAVAVFIMAAEVVLAVLELAPLQAHLEPTQ
jgi:hypothetical protein